MKKPLSWREWGYNIIYESDTPAGRFFDIFIICCILISVIVVMLDSVGNLDDKYGALFYNLQWFFTLLFTVEYALRIACINNPWRYVTSYYGIIDLLSILPIYLSLFANGLQYLMVIRLLRVLRIFRAFKMSRYSNESSILYTTFRQKQDKIFVLIFVFMTVVVIVGTIMFLIESPNNPNFSNIPISVYWAIVTITTVGFGDIVPLSSLGKMLASLIMLMGYSVLAVPAVQITSEMARKMKKIGSRACPNCSQEGHDTDADFCKWCGSSLSPEGE